MASRYIGRVGRRRIGGFGGKRRMGTVANWEAILVNRDESVP
jgi:hypothetical protein